MPQQVGPPRSAGWFTYAPSRSMTASISLSASTMAQSPETKGAPNARRQGAAKLLSGIGSPRFADRGKAREGKSVVEGKRVSVRVELGGQRSIKKTHLTLKHDLVIIPIQP